MGIFGQEPTGRIQGSDAQDNALGDNRALIAGQSHIAGPAAFDQTPPSNVAWMLGDSSSSATEDIMVVDFVGCDVCERIVGGIVHINLDGYVVVVVVVVVL